MTNPYGPSNPQDDIALVYKFLVDVRDGKKSEHPIQEILDAVYRLHRQVSRRRQLDPQYS